MDIHPSLRPSSHDKEEVTPTIKQVISEAQDANSQEHELSFLEALRLFPYGVFWAIIVSTTIIMEGYDTKVIGSLFAQPAFQKAYGDPVHGKPGSYQLSAAWQSGLSNGAACGQLFGLVVAGYVSERYGFRKSMIAGLGSMVFIVFILFFANSLVVLLVGGILFGIPLGIFQTTVVVYASEVLPLRLRPYLTNYVHTCWAFGQLMAAGVMRGVLNRKDQWAYRIPFALQWIWPVLLIPLIMMAPESPWWLVRTGRLHEAKKALLRLVSQKRIGSSGFDIDKNISLMVLTVDEEREQDSRTSYMACFQGTNLRRTLIVIGVYCIQTLNGNSLRSNAAYFFQQAGLSNTQSFNMAIGLYAVAITGGTFSWVLLPVGGRFPIYFSALWIETVIMLSIGILGIYQAQPDSSPSYSWAIASILVSSSFLYYSTIGPLTNTFCSEIPSTIVRSKSIALARWMYIITTIVAGVLTPYMMNPTAWDWKAKAGFFWTGGCVIALVFTWFCLPETKDRTSVEMDILFRKGLKARAFKRTTVDISRDGG